MLLFSSIAIAERTYIIWKISMLKSINAKMSTKSSPKKLNQAAAEKTQSIISEPRRIRYGTSSLILDEAELRRAGIRNYRVEIKSCTNGKWEVLYNKSGKIGPVKSNTQNENK